MKEALSAESLDVLLQRVATWAATRSDIRAVALVGSYARGTPTDQSDIDLVMLTTNPDEYIQQDNWVDELHIGDPIVTKDWGAITERRLRRGDGLEIEVGIGIPEWASLDPIDPGTRKVVTDGLRPLHDPDDLLLHIVTACS